MGGPGFALGVAQGLQQAQSNAFERQRLDLETKFNQARMKAMDLEGQLKQQQIQAALQSAAFERGLPQAFSDIFGGGVGAQLGSQDQGPPSSGFNRNAFLQLLLSAPPNQRGPLLEMAQLQDTTGTVKQMVESLRPDELQTLGAGQRLVNISRGQGAQAQPPTTPSAQPSEEAMTTDQPLMMPENQQTELLALNQKMLEEVNRRLDENDTLRRAATNEEDLKFLINQNQALLEAKRDVEERLTGLQQVPVEETPTEQQTTLPEVSTGPVTRGGVTITPLVEPGPGEMDTPTAEETKIMAELFRLNPSKAEAFRATNGRNPSYAEALQLYDEQELAAAMRAKEERTQADRVAVARQTGVEAQERAFDLAQKKEKIPEKPSSTERKELSDDLRALESLLRLPDEFKPEFVGPFMGRIGNLKEFFGTLEGDEARFRGIVANVRNRVIKAITGAQMGEKEATRIRQELPEFNLSPEAFIARVQLSLENLHMMARIRRDIMSQTGVDLSDLAPLPQVEGVAARRTRKITLETGLVVDVPEPNERLRTEGGIGPVGAAKEKHRQAQKRFNEQEFLKALPEKKREQYQQLDPGDKVRFRDMLFEKTDRILSLGDQ